jgi:hypothetical protein
MPNVSSTSFAVWIAYIVLYAALSGLIVYRRAAKRHAWLFLYSSTSCITNIALVWLYHDNSPAGCFWTYWSCRFLLAIFEFSLIWTIARALLGINQAWRRRLLEGMAVLTVVALGISAAITLASPAPFYLAVTRVVTSLDRWLSLAACIVFVTVAFSFDALGIRWRRETLAIGLGLALQGAAFTCFSWMVSIMALSQAQWQLPSLLRDISEILAVAIWIHAFIPASKTDTLSGITATSITTAIEQMEHIAIQR